MTPEMLLPLVIGIIGAAIGGLLVWMYYYLRSGTTGSKPRSTETTPAIQQDDHERLELLRVVRDKGNEMVIFVQGHPHRHLWEVTDLQISQETIQAIKAVLGFANIGNGAMPGTSTPRSMQPESASLERAPVKAPPVTTPAPNTDVQKRASAEPENIGSPSRKERLSMLNRPGRMLEPLQFVEDIERRFQEKIAGRSDLLERRIHVTVAPSGGIRIYMDQHYFDAVGDIPDPEVKALIQDAIREWERA